MPEARSKVQQLSVDENNAGQRLDRALSSLLPGVPRTRIFRLIRKGEVRVNGKRAGPEQRLLAGDLLRVPPVREQSESAVRVAAGGSPRVPSALRTLIERAIIHEDERLLVLDKPAGVAVHGGSGLSFGVIEALRDLRPDETLELAHRLDRDTSGCLMVTRKPAAKKTAKTAAAKKPAGTSAAKKTVKKKTAKTPAPKKTAAKKTAKKKAKARR